MKQVKINFENCYGIGKISHTFDFSLCNSVLIYAPNGTMKTSLAKTFNYFGDGTIEAPSDRAYPARVPVFEIDIDGKVLNPGNDCILVINPENTSYDSSHRISSFIAGKDLKERYDKIYDDLNERKEAFIRSLKAVSKSSDCESEVINTFKISDENLFDILENLQPSLDAKAKKYDFKYNDVFDKGGKVKKFLEKNQPVLDQYLSSYTDLLTKSSFFKQSGNSFGTYQATEILDSIKDNSFFEAGHTFQLSNDMKIESVSALKALIETEISSIINDKSLKDIFDKIDKTIGSNAELRSFKSIIENDNLLILELKDFENFKKKVWVGYLSELKTEVIELCSFYASQKKEIEAILAEADKEVEIWKTLIETFNNRFYVPFKIILSNQKDVILKKDTANLDFFYADRNDTATKQDKEALLKMLSKGEQRAYYILQFLFDIESRRSLSSKTLIVLDDIADSFDYKNKYAIIEYIKDLHLSGNFRIIILTHNFDFYRTIGSRLGMKRGIKAILMATRDGNNEITLSEGQYINDVFKNFLGRASEQRVFLSFIPFLRNLIEYTDIDGENSTDYETLTKCLHLKTGSESITANDIKTIWNSRFTKQPFSETAFDTRNIIELIYETADKIVIDCATSTDDIALENKIILSIAARLKTEQFILTYLDANSITIPTITSNQTSELCKEYKKAAPTSFDKIKILDKVNLMTPSNIHLNAFMYEPLIDISLKYLIDLYQSTKAL